MKWILGFLTFFTLLSAQAQVNHNLMRRVTVFPLSTEKSHSKSAEEAWWKIRETLTENKRFLVASKNFLIKKDVYQARGALSPADAIILGQLLDADALVVTYLEKRELHMKVYEGEYGRLLWTHSIHLHPSIPVAKQLVESSQRLINDFIAAVPYQGFVVSDSLIGKTVYQEKGRSFFKVDVGDDSQIEVGDQAQVVRIYSDRLIPMFGGEATIEVFTEGRVIARQRNIVTVEILKTSSTQFIAEKALVKFPKEFKRLRQSLAIRDNLKRKVRPDYLSPEMKDYSVEERETKPLITALTFVGNLAIFLLLGF